MSVMIQCVICVVGSAYEFLVARLDVVGLPGPFVLSTCMSSSPGNHRYRPNPSLTLPEPQQTACLNLNLDLTSGDLPAMSAGHHVSSLLRFVSCL